MKPLEGFDEWDRARMEKTGPGEHEAYIFHVLLTPEERRHMHEDDFPTLQLFTEEEEPCKQ